MNVYLESLGCPKNQVDSDMMLGQLNAAGLNICDTPETAHTIIINTCSFIEAAADEAIDTILSLARLKQDGACSRLIVCGCLPERYRENLAASMPEVDCFLGTGAYNQIVEAVMGQPLLSGCILPPPDKMPLPVRQIRRGGVRTASAYLKLAEGCDRHCTYCIIPRLRGGQRSRPPEAILNEARQLIAAGVREIVLVAQETSAYGVHLSPSPTLPQLLTDLADLSDQVWIRLLYLHPESLTRVTIQAIGERENICGYFDIPVQHASDDVLKRMGRHYTVDDLYRLIDLIRETVPDAALRTTALVGFPGETDRDFQELFDFTQKIQFDHLGVFVYSDADDLPSHRLNGHVPELISQQRYDALMSAQAAVSLAQNNTRTGNRFDVLIENTLDPGVFVGRTWFQAPEIDGITCFNGPSTLATGNVVPVRITDASEYDLTGEAV